MKLFLFLIATLSLTSCASYRASTLTPLSETTTTSKANISISAKAFNKADSKEYLGRDVLAKGYQPVQLYIQNNSNASYLFSLNRLGLSCARSEEVANRVHTSTVGRVVGYSAAAFFTCGLFVIPAIIDGIKSSNANESLDADFSAKTARDTVIGPYCHFNKILFVPVKDYNSSFKLTLVEQSSNKPETFSVFVQ